MANKLPDSGPISMLDIYNVLEDTAISPQNCDYYFETIENFKSRRNAIITLNNNDLSKKTFGFGDGVNNLNNAFDGTSIISTPKMIVANNVVDSYACFNDCFSLTSISKDLLNYCTSIISFDKLFRNCTALKTVPSELFDNCTKASNYSNCFYGCTNITSALPEIWNKNKFPSVRNGVDYAKDCINATNYNTIPSNFGGPSSNPILPLGPQDCDYYFEGLDDFNNRRNQIIDENNGDLSQKTFGFNDAVGDLNHGFEGTNIIALPKMIFSDHIVDFYACFSECNSITSIPEKLFENCPKVISFDSTFSQCSNLTTIPQSLFDNCKKATNFGNCFSSSSNITSSLPDVWNKVKFPAVTNGSNYAKGCTKAANYNEIPSNFGGPARKITLLNMNNVTVDATKTLISRQLLQKTINLPANSISIGQLNFRELAGILNGQISLRDFYGKQSTLKPLLPTTPQECDYYFETIEDFRAKIKNIVEAYGGDLSNVTLGFSDNVTELYQAFLNIGTSVYEAPKMIFGRRITDFSYCFLGHHITKIPDKIFNKCVSATNFYCCFSNTRITEIPEGLFDSCTNATNFGSCFENCLYLKNIPFTLFDKCKNITNFSETFNKCTNVITKLPDAWNTSKFPRVSEKALYASGCTNASNYNEVPYEFRSPRPIPNTPQECDYYFETREEFDNKVDIILTENNKDLIEKTFGFGDRITNLNNAFKLKFNMISTPKMIFSRNITSFENCFLNSNIVNISPNLFDNCPNATNFKKCFSGNDIEIVPNGLFRHNTKATDFEECFSYCYFLTSIPQGLFDNCPNVINFTKTFQLDEIKSIPSGLFRNNSKVTTFEECFAHCDLIEIPQGLFDNCPNVNNFNGCFQFCNSLMIVPQNLFDRNRNAIMYIGSCFWACENITSALPDAWNKSKFPNIRSYYGYARSCKNAANYAEIPNDWK